ncbi:MAG: tRNA pseudouridine(38-40) synthase TruA [Planctomycetota bacterium]
MDTDTTETPRRNIKLVIAYDGQAYHGWQRQAAGIDTVQERIETAASAVLRHPVTVHGAGRTDAGVHADGQVANLRTANPAVPLVGLRRAMNSRLPGDIAVRSASLVPDGFHASISAIGKTYRYRIHVSPRKCIHRDGRVYRYFKPLDTDLMRRAARRLIGTHDFRSFATSAEIRENTVRTIFRCDVAEADDEIHVTVQGDGFLYNMVRIIVGTLMDVGRGHWSPERIDEILVGCDRRLAGPTAVPDGLTMVCVHYRPEDLTIRQESPPQSGNP